MYHAPLAVVLAVVLLATSVAAGGSCTCQCYQHVVPDPVIVIKGLCQLSWRIIIAIYAVVVVFHERLQLQSHTLLTACNVVLG